MAICGLLVILAKMADHTPHQKKIIQRYYDQRDRIMLRRLQEIVTEIYLAESERRSDQLWKRAGNAMAALKVPAGIIEHIVTKRDPETLARNLRGWMDVPHERRRADRGLGH